MYEASHSTGLNLSLEKAFVQSIHRFMLCSTRYNILSGKGLRIHRMSATCIHRWLNFHAWNFSTSEKWFFSDMSCLYWNDVSRECKLPMGSFFYHYAAVASNCAFRARSVHTYATLSQFKRSCAPHCVSQCASDCDADRSLRKISIDSFFEPLNIIFKSKIISRESIREALHIYENLGNTFYEKI